MAACFAAAVPVGASETLFPDSCDGTDLRVQVLGSGDADFADGRAASSYLVWIDGKARVLVDAGAGSALRFAESGAGATDIDAILLTQLGIAHALDLPALIAHAQRAVRTRVLPLYGPTGNRLGPSTVTFVRALLDGTRGAYRELSSVLNPLAKDGFKLQPHDVRTRAPSVGVRRDARDVVEIVLSPQLRAAATYVTDAGAPVLAWRLRIGSRSLVFGGAVTGDANHLPQLAQAADLLIVDDPGAAPSAIGRIAAQTKAKRLVLTRRTRAALTANQATLAAVRKDYDGPVAFADDLDCFVVAEGQ